MDLKSVFVSNLLLSSNPKGIRNGMKLLSFFNSNYMTKVSPLLSCCYKGTSPEATPSPACLSSSITMVGENYTFSRYDDGINISSVSTSSLLRGKPRVLDAFDDEYGGVVVNPDRLPIDPNVFASILKSSLSVWRTQSKKGIWLKLPLQKSDLVPIAVREGFQYHHAETGYVMMTYWIPNEPCMLPANASHQVGVGGFVMNDKNEVLVVQEKHCAPELAGLWKLPTGFIHESEEIFNGAVREVKEETGIDTEFLEVIAFRHVHNVAFQKSDLFFICMLRPVSSEIKIDGLEVQAAKWMEFNEFVEQPLIKGDKMFKKIIDICIARIGKRYCGLSVHKVVSTFDNRLSSLYYNVVDDQNLDSCSVYYS